MGEVIKTILYSALGLGVLIAGILVVMYPFAPHFVEDVLMHIITGGL